MTALVLLLALAAEEFQPLALQAAKARESNDIASALQLYRRAVELRPDWAEGWWYVATLLYDRDQYAEAVPAFERYLKLENRSAPGWSLLGLCEFQLKKYDLALAHLLVGKALGMPVTDPISRVARHHRAILQTHFRRYDAALDELKKFTFPAYDTPAVIQAVGIAALRSPLLPQEVPADQREIVTKTGRAVYDSWAAQSDQAARGFEELVSAYPTNPHIRFLYGSFLLHGHSDAGLRELQKCLELDRAYVPALLQLAFEYLTRREPAPGIRYAEEAVKLAPDSFVPHNALGRLFVAQGDLRRGIAELEIAVKLAPDSAECHFALASAYNKAGRKQRASKHQAEFLRLDKLRAQAEEK